MPKPETDQISSERPWAVTPAVGRSSTPSTPRCRCSPEDEEAVIGVVRPAFPDDGCSGLPPLPGCCECCRRCPSSPSTWKARVM